MTIKTELTPTQIALGEIYAWIHSRAEYLRQQKNAAAGTDSEAQTSDGDATPPDSGTEQLESTTNDYE